MFIKVFCDCEDCVCNENGYCVADMGISIENGECVVYEPRGER